MAASMKMTIFWDVAPSHLVEIDIALMMEAVSYSRTQVNLYQTTYMLQHPRRQLSSTTELLVQKIPPLHNTDVLI
jgi:hypothetical protein